VNKPAIQAELDDNWEVLAEPIQTVMRMYGVKNPYEKLKEMTRGKKVDQQILSDFVDKLDIPKEAKERLKELRPETYVGVAKKLVSL